MKTRFLTILLLLTCTAGYSQIQKVDSVPVPPAFVSKINKTITWFSDTLGLQLRRTFDGSKNESKPASISWNADYEGKKHYNIVDAGLKLLSIEPFKKSAGVALLFYPKIEWHRNSISNNDKQKNNLTGGINTEFLWTFGDHWYENPYITGSFDYKKDFIKDLKTTQTKGYFTFSGSKEGSPGAVIRNKRKVMLFRYYPYTGLEYYRSIGESGQKASMWVNRLYFEFYPLSFKDYSYVQLSFDYTYRRVFSDNLYNQGNMGWLLIGLNFYPTGKANLGLGLDYSQGEDPTSNFVKTKLLALGIKLKI